MEHRMVAEQMLGRLLEPHEHVHHKNSLRGDNRLENLEVMDGRAHNQLHAFQNGLGHHTRNAR